MLSLFLFNHFKMPKIPTGATWLGITSLTYSVWSNRRRNSHQEQVRREHADFQNQVQRSLEDLNAQTQEILRNQNKSLKERILENLPGRRKYTDGDNNFFDNLHDYFNDYLNFFSNLSPEQQIILLNLLCSLLLLTYIMSIIMINYSNYLITRFNLEVKYPRIAIYLNYRRKFQRYYIYWNLFSIFIILTIMISTNLVLFLDFYF